MNAWVVLDASAWRSLPLTRQHEIRAWLKMNGISPVDVPADSTVSLVPGESGAWYIQHETYRRSVDGRIIVDPDKPDEAYVRECAVPLQIDPPVHWLTPAS